MCLDDFIGVRFKSQIVFNLRKNLHSCLFFKISYSFMGQIIKASKEFRANIHFLIYSSFS